MKTYPYALIASCLLVFSLAFLSGCGENGNRSAATSESDPVTPNSEGQAKSDDLQETKTADEPRKIESPLRQSNTGGNVTVYVTWANPTVAENSTIRFAIAMDTHSVELDGYDLSKLAILRNDQGIEAVPVEWGAPAGGHHRNGQLLFSKSKEGQSLLRADTKTIELTIRNVAGVKERKYSWEVSP